MVIENFFNKWNSRFVDYDGKFGNQCMDLMRQYIKERFGTDAYKIIPPVNYAKNAFYNYPNETQYFKKILNGPTNSPAKGDIVFFKTSLWWPWYYGIAGHVEIVSQADMYNMINFAQNWPTGSPCHFQKRKYKDCLGWLTPKT